jgi:DNA-binding NtrC family response regulator
MVFDIPSVVLAQSARIEVVFDPGRTLDGWTCELLEAATHVAALVLEIERALGRPPQFARVRRDGAAPLIGSSRAIRQVRERIERVAATDFTILIEGGIGPLVGVWVRWPPSHLRRPVDSDLPSPGGQAAATAWLTPVRRS